jgi:hypothetical protein
MSLLYDASSSSSLPEEEKEEKEERWRAQVSEVKCSAFLLRRL